MSKTHIDIDEELLAQVARITGTSTKRETVEAALRATLRQGRRRAAVERLTHRGWHRAPGPVDLLLAATALEHDMSVLHLDEDVELIAQVSSLRQQRVVPAGGPPAR